MSKFSYSENRIGAQRLMLFSFLLSSLSGFAGMAYAETSFERLSSLLDETPGGGWVKASTNYFSDAWPTGDDAVPGGSPERVIAAWSSFAWDTARGSLMLWGGGHANYAGNEMYVWDGATGAWGRGSLPSKFDFATGYTVGGTAPPSSHTYDNNLYLPVNDMFLTFGGAAIKTGSIFQTIENGTVRRAGPFMWDPLKADPTKLGGSTDSGWNTANPPQNGNMWIDRHGSFTGTEPQSYINVTTAYHAENGHDVVYFTADRNASGRPSLYRYIIGDVRNGGQDVLENVGFTLERIGAPNNTLGYQTAATIDTVHNLYIKTATLAGPYISDLAIWDLDNVNAANPASNLDIGINLVKADGTDFTMNSFYGIDYDPALNTIFLWDGSGNGGTVWGAEVLTDASGNIGANTTWTVHELTSSTLDHPHGNFVTGVLGKWHYDASLGAFIALDEATPVGKGLWDASVWLYKPTAVTSVPEPETYVMLLAGLGLIGAMVSRRRIFS
jgi:hypothetical protein